MYNFQESLFNYRENQLSAKKKKYKYRFNELWVRYKGFKNMDILKLQTIPYVIKPLFAGMIPQCMIKLFQIKK